MQKKTSTLKIIAIIISVAAAIAGLAVVLCKIFKKYFTIEFECGDCDSCETPCVNEDDAEEIECIEDEADDAEESAEA